MPEPFRRVQWTRLKHGVPAPQFVEQVKRLLEAPRRPVLGGRQVDAGGMVGVSPRQRIPIWAAAAAAVSVLAVAGYLAPRPSAKEVDAPKPTVTEVKPPPTVPVHEKSIAVLPFENGSADKQNEFFAA